MRPMISIVTMLVAGAIGCDTVSSELAGEPCTSEADCSAKQSCARTDEEIARGLPGACDSRQRGCVPGQQLGCACTPDDVELDCSMQAIPVVVAYPSMICDAVRLVCIDAEAGGASSGSTTSADTEG